MLNPTHDPARRSWVESANAPGTDFPVQNLPLGVFFLPTDVRSRIGVAIGGQVFDLARAFDAGLLGGAGAAGAACAAPMLKPLMALGPDEWSSLRRRLFDLLDDNASGAGSSLQRAVRECLVPMDAVEMRLPAVIGDYTDFYASVFHAANVGSLFRPDNPLLPNYKFVPIGYHGRASSIVVSGTGVVRPAGQTRPDPAVPPTFGPAAKLDYELEVGWFVGTGNALGQSIPLGAADDHIFGFCLLNDWSARDIQQWEYQPLGPFLAKSFATTISPWIVTSEALEPFRAGAFSRPAGDPAPLAYLDSEANRTRGGLDITLGAWLQTTRMREAGADPVRLSRSNFRDMYWTPAQMLTHHASNGCNLRPGDLLASGTVSGPEPDAGGCLLELTRGGRNPIHLPNGETRRFLEDGDEVILRGSCERPGLVRIGFGECRGLILGARQA
jgi:fumarylacetoacetase